MTEPILPETMNGQHRPTLAPTVAEVSYRTAMLKAGVPEHIHDALVLYLVHRVRTGSFLRAVLENNLKEAVARADEVSGRHLVEIVRFLYTCAPHPCWGNQEAVDRWLAGEL